MRLSATLAASTLLNSFLSVQVRVEFEMQRNTGAQRSKRETQIWSEFASRKKKKKQRTCSKQGQVEWEGCMGGGAKWGRRTGKMRHEVREGGGFEDQVRWNTLVLFCQAGSVTQKELLAQTGAALHKNSSRSVWGFQERNQVRKVRSDTPQPGFSHAARRKRKGARELTDLNQGFSSFSRPSEGGGGGQGTWETHSGQRLTRRFHQQGGRQDREHFQHAPCVGRGAWEQSQKKTTTTCGWVKVNVYLCDKKTLKGSFGLFTASI